LEKLFGRPADLVTERSIRNPYFRESVLPLAILFMTVATKKLLLDVHQNAAK
jgi:hypothetical protein